MSPEYLLVPEIKDVLKKKNGDMSKRHKGQWGGVCVGRSGTF